MTSKQVRGPSKNWHPASEGTLKTDIQQVRGPSSNNRVFFLLKHPYVTLEPLLGKGYKITGCFFFFKLSNWPLNKISESNCKIQGIYVQNKPIQHYCCWNSKHSNHRRLKIGGSGKQKNFLSFFCDVLWIPNIAESFSGQILHHGSCNSFRFQ